MTVINRYNAAMRNLEYRLRKFKDSLPDILSDVIWANRDLIVSTIAETQLYEQGINGRGQEIMSYRPYKPSTIERKRKKGQPTTRVTLRDTGKFHGSMFLVVDDEGFYITSDDEKTKYLIKKYGEEIFRLTNENFNKILRENIRRELKERLQETIQI